MNQLQLSIPALPGKTFPIVKKSNCKEDAERIVDTKVSPRWRNGNVPYKAEKGSRLVS